MPLFVATTEVGRAQARLFEAAELRIEVLPASACMPTLHDPVRIDGRAFWDGGLTADPPLLPLVHRSAAPELLAVLLHAWRGPSAPVLAEGISHRLGETAFASSFASQLQGIAPACQAVAAGAGGAASRGGCVRCGCT